MRLANERLHVIYFTNRTPNLSVRAASVEDLLTREGTPSNDEGSDVTCHGVILDGGMTVRSKAVVLTTGTFLRGCINFGTETFPGMVVLILLEYPFPCCFSDISFALLRYCLKIAMALVIR